MANVAFLGTGRMGRVLATHLINAGHQVTVWNRTAASAQPLVDLGAVLAPTAKAAATGAAIVITCLFGPATVDEVIIDKGVLAAGQLWVDITTVGPDDAARYAAWAAENQIKFVYAPVVGSLAPARARKLGTYLGGPAGAIATARPLVALWCDPDRIVELPDQDFGGNQGVGARQAAGAKLLANLALAISLQGLVEALQFGKTQGFSPAQVLKVLHGTALGWIGDFKGPMINSEAFSDTQFSVDLLAKDMNLALAAAGSSASFPAITAALASLQHAQQNGDGDQDIAAVVKPVL